MKAFVAVLMLLMVLQAPKPAKGDLAPLFNIVPPKYWFPDIVFHNQYSPEMGQQPMEVVFPFYYPINVLDPLGDQVFTPYYVSPLLKVHIGEGPLSYSFGQRSLFMIGQMMVISFDLEREFKPDHANVFNSSLGFSYDQFHIRLHFDQFRDFQRLGLSLGLSWVLQKCAMNQNCR